MINSIYNIDALEGLKKIKSDFIDLICIDPPYGINYAKWDKKGEMNYIKLNIEFDRILKDTGNYIIFCGWSNINDILKINSFYLQQWIIWDRIKGRGAKRHFTSTREDILWFSKTKKYTFNKISSTIKKKTKGMGFKNGNEFRSLSNVWTDISLIVPWSKEKLQHPTQKPVALIERIIKIFSNENDIILDCFAGSGTTGEACKNLNRNFILFENNKKYYKIMEERLYNESMFNKN
jgi:DNA modification methylase